MKKLTFFIVLFLLSFSFAWAQKPIKITKRTTEAQLKMICADLEKQGGKLEITQCERKKNGNIYILAGKVTNAQGATDTFHVKNMNALIIETAGKEINITAQGVFIEHNK